MTNKTAALRYARALFDVALKERADFDALERELSGFIDLFAQHPALAKAMLNPAVPVPRKRAAMAELTTLAQTPPVITRLLALLADRDRLVLLPDLLAAFQERLRQHRHIVRAQVTTAVPLEAGKTAAVEQSLAAATKSTVSLETRVDPSIIGGVVAKVGSVVYDASVTRHLQRMKERMRQT
jgi:F-type H+-transporting ATPase subunit delta